MNTETKNFTTSDLNCAAFLICHKIQFIKTYEQYTNHFIFELSDAPKSSQLAQEYLNDSPINIRSFLSAREMLLSQIKNRERTRNVI